MHAVAALPATVAVSRQVVLRVMMTTMVLLKCYSCVCDFVCSAQHAQDKRVMEKLKLTHVINASNKIDNPHVGQGGSVVCSRGCMTCVKRLTCDTHGV